MSSLPPTVQKQGQRSPTQFPSCERTSFVNHDPSTFFTASKSLMKTFKKSFNCVWTLLPCSTSGNEMHDIVNWLRLDIALHSHVDIKIHLWRRHWCLTAIQTSTESQICCCFWALSAFLHFNSFLFTIFSSHTTVFLPASRKLLYTVWTHLFKSYSNFLLWSGRPDDIGFLSAIILSPEFPRGAIQSRSRDKKKPHTSARQTLLTVYTPRSCLSADIFKTRCYVEEVEEPWVTEVFTHLVFCHVCAYHPHTNTSEKFFYQPCVRICHVCRRPTF